MNYLTESPPIRATPLQAADGIARVVAPNPGPMTYHGTNTWLVDTREGRVVIDPGPDDPRHVAALCEVAGPIARILLTHGHRDHSGAVPALVAATGAPVTAWPDLRDGETIAGLTAIHTPGHAPDHLCFAHPSGHLFSGDHVMGWSSSTVSPPAGDMAAYLASLERLLLRAEHTYLPGHGPAIPDPRPFVAALRDHRLAREADLRRALADGPRTLSGLREILYPGLRRELTGAAERTLLAHLGKLAQEGAVAPDGGLGVTPGGGRGVAPEGGRGVAPEGGRGTDTTLWRATA